VKRLLIDENLPFSIGARIGVDYINSHDLVEMYADRLEAISFPAGKE